VPDDLWGGPYSLKARWGEYAERVESAAVATVEIKDGCDLYVSINPEVSFAHPGEESPFRVYPGTHCPDTLAFDLIITEYDGPAEIQTITYQGEPVDVIPGEPLHGILPPGPIPLNAPLGSYEVTAKLYREGELLAVDYGTMTIQERAAVPAPAPAVVDGRPGERSGAERGRR
jgi:hypothetical protein